MFFDDGSPTLARMGDARPSTPAPGATTVLALDDRRAITRAATGIGAYAALFGVTFGAIAAAAHFDIAQVLVMSTLMFTGASQFAFVGILGAGGSALAGIATALLLGVRNGFYGVPVSSALRPRGLQRLVTAHFVIDETTAMLAARHDPRARRYAFWATGVILWACWSAGSLLGVLIGAAVNPTALGLDAAAPAVFLALLWPQITTRRPRAVSAGAAAVALALIPVTPAGVPVIAAAGIAVVAGLVPERHGGSAR